MRTQPSTRSSIQSSTRISATLSTRYCANDERLMHQVSLAFCARFGLWDAFQGHHSMHHRNRSYFRRYVIPYSSDLLTHFDILIYCTSLVTILTIISTKLKKKVQVQKHTNMPENEAHEFLCKKSLHGTEVNFCFLFGRLVTELKFVVWPKSNDLGNGFVNCSETPPSPCICSQ